METRLLHLKQAFLGYQKTGIPLIDFDGQHLVPSLTSDDIGIYVIIPKIAHYFNASLDFAIPLFFYSIILIPAIIGIIGFFKYYTSFLIRSIGFPLIIYSF